MAVKPTTNKYGLWQVQVAKAASSRAKAKTVAVIESNLKGVERWLEDNGLRPDRHELTLLPEVEYVDPVNDSGILGMGGVRQSKKKPGPIGTAKVVKGTTKLSPYQIRKLQRATRANATNSSGYCKGSGMLFSRSQRGKRVLCTTCSKMMQVNYSDGRMRQHKP